MPKRRKVAKEWCAKCQKFSYKTWNMACTIVLHQSRKTGTPLRIYPCPNNHGHHITKKMNSFAAK